MKVYVVLAHADNWGRDIRGIYSTRERAREAVLAMALDDSLRYQHHHIAKVTVDVDGPDELDWMGPE